MRTWFGVVVVVVVVVACTPRPVAIAPQSVEVAAGSGSDELAPFLAQERDRLEHPEPPAFRLPTDVVPIRERVELTIIPGSPRARGEVVIDAMVTKPTDIVWLHAEGLHIYSASFGEGATPMGVHEHGDLIGLRREYRAKGEYPGFLQIPAGPTKFFVTFDAPIDADRSRGMYSAIDQPSGEPYVYTFFEPIDARRAFPCFDEPSFKIPWTLVFHVREHDVALGNAPVVRETPEPNGMKKVELAETKPLPSYLVAFVVGPFDVVDDGTAGRAATPIRFVVPKGHLGELGFAKRITPHVVAALEDYFDMPYPFGKLDVAVVPRYWGTMEHPGIVAMGQPLTLIAPDQDTRDREEGYTNILAHELGHYWFGDLVTMAWWDDTWLNEALGEWLDMIITDAVRPDWHHRERRVSYALWAMSSDETLAAQPIHHDVDTTDAIESSFDNDTTYFKGSSVVRDIEAFVGPDKWRDFVRAYVRKHAGGNASARDFTGEMRAALGDTAADAFTTYIMQPGVPLVRIACNGDHLAIERSRALPAGVTAPPPTPWPVPVCVRYGDAKHAQRTCTTGDAIAVASCPKWIVPNDNATGYYRSAVDPALLDTRAAKLSGAEKRMVVADVNEMARRGELPVDRQIAGAVALTADPDPRVAQSAFAAAQFRNDAFDDAFYAAAVRWRRATFGKLAHALGWHRARGDSDEREQLREDVLEAAGGDDPALVKAATAVADDWLAHHTKIDFGLVAAALDISIRNGDAARFDRYVAAAKTTSAAEREEIVAALGAVRTPELAQRALGLLLGNELDLRDAWPIAVSTAEHRETRDVAVAFLRAHLDELLPRLREDEQSWLLSGLAAAACDAEHRDALAALIAPRAAKSETAKLAVARNLEKSAQCIAQAARERSALERLIGLP